jgi:transposase-like protein
MSTDAWIEEHWIGEAVLPRPRRAGALVDVMLSEHRDLAAANAFFRSAKARTGVTPDRVTTDDTTLPYHA